jgi:hypothetical protein
MVQPQFKGQTYGEATQQRRSVQAVPTGNAPTEQRAPFGPGVGPAAAGIPIPPPNVDNVIEELKAIYQMYPNDDLADLLDSALREGY